MVEEADCVVTGEAAHGKQFLPFSAVLAIGRERLAANPSVFEQRWQRIRPEDPVGMMYTSGTTGDPKGVVLTHLNVLYEAIVVDRINTVADFPDTIAYLPLAHIAERELSLYGTSEDRPRPPVPRSAPGRRRAGPGAPGRAVRRAAHLGEARRRRPGPAQGGRTGAARGVRKAHALTLEAFDLRAAGKQVPEDMAEAVAEADRTVLAPVRAMLGLDRVGRATSGAAPISVETLRFLHGLGIPLMELWGMSETSGAATCCTPRRTASAPSASRSRAWT